MPVSIEHTNNTVKAHFKKVSVSRYISTEYIIFIQAFRKIDLLYNDRMFQCAYRVNHRYRINTLC